MKSKALIDDRSYYVTLRHDGAVAPIWRSPWLQQADAHTLAQQKREEVQRAGWAHRVQIFYRDGSEVK